MIGGDTNLIIESLVNQTGIYDGNGKRIGEFKAKVASLYGWLDLVTGDSNYTYKAKIEDSTHVFICDYVNIDDVNIEESRAIVKGEIYEIKYIDDPMELHAQLEIYLKKVGGQNGD